jgi:uncharacterized coiled-coil protein SlyX
MAVARRSNRKPAESDRARIAALETALAHFSETIEHLRREMDINIKRMGAMQAEIDHLRALIRRND